MNDKSRNAPPLRNWLERLSLAFTGEPRDRAQLIDLLRSAHQREILDPDALGMIEGVLQVAEMQVRDIMVPRAQMDVVRGDGQLMDILPVITESAHSRFPVVGDSRDEVLGILLAKDLLRYFVDGNTEDFDMRDVLRPAVFVPESKRLNVLLKEFRNSRNHMAIVVDEYGGVAGLVTIEDVLEQIVGEIDDEHDIEDYLTHIMRHPSGRYTVKALTPIDEFNQYFSTDYSEEEFDTIGGLVVNRFGHVPKRGDELVFDRFQVRVLRADNRRVHLLEMRLREDVEPTVDGE
ncbi:Mg2+/Co2+ transporter [Thioalkalivibrio sulfidiphilus HL-EbGr7]|uniref:Magnesium and cobalt efflux protein CorC n=1 Tax=Thioalkalivibrio sulfidiphilus (strain HL-EbGR7) TaxID=396588 RepID=B8GV23_THISH|nr:transporter associated domain-containing protein [Thioalkalivibrio sulfidiphilus]ACL73369.1 Mg2+/Co2+ transporter [Thioalkalivibrio sulfidiphilus HL-EbGr7]